MRSIVFLILTTLLTIGMLAAQEDAGPETAKQPPDFGVFSPSEAVEADTAIAFPTDI